jgi:hypothetical protein
MVSLNKKGDMQYELPVKIIGSVVVLIILVGIVVFIFEEVVNPTTNDEICRTSVALKTKTKVPGGYKTLTDLKCPRSQVDSKAKTKDQIKLELATQMYRCWYKFGEGKLDFYSNIDPGFSETHCLICSEIYFEDGVEELSFGEFGSYLNNRNLPGQTKTFSEYFKGEKNSKISMFPASGDDSVRASSIMELDKPVYVVYKVNKRSETLEEIKDVVGTGAYGAGAKTYGVIATKLATNVGTRLIPIVGWSLVIKDVVDFAVLKEGFYPSLELFSVDKIEEVCDSLT